MPNNHHASIIELPALDHVDAWEEPIYFENSETPDIPACVLPGVLGEFAHALATATETPEALTVMTILGVLSTAVAKYVYICPQAGWHEPINLYTLIALPPANNKSLVLRSCTKPLIEWEQEQAALVEADIKRQRSARKSEEKIIESLRARLAKLKSREEQQQLIQDIADKEAAFTELPTLSKLFVNDATPEALALSAYEQGGRLALFSDEGGLLETLAGLYSHGAANVDILLKGIDGGEMRVQRKDRSFQLKPYLTIVLTVQPSIVRNLGLKKAYAGNGALERFLYVLPKSKLGYRTHDKPAVPTSLQTAYNAKIKALLNCYAKTTALYQSQYLSLMPSAHQHWKAFQTTIEPHLRPEGKLAACQGWGGKLCGYALRLAGLLHMAQAGPQQLMITENTMANALDMAEVLMQHAIAAYGFMNGDQTVEDAKEVFNWISNKGALSFTQSDITFAMRNKKLGKPDRLAKALHALIERNLISPPQKLPTRKPTTLFRVHPQVFTGTRHATAN